MTTFGERMPEGDTASLTLKQARDMVNIAVREAGLHAQTSSNSGRRIGLPEQRERYGRDQRRRFNRAAVKHLSSLARPVQSEGEEYVKQPSFAILKALRLKELGLK